MPRTKTVRKKPNTKQSKLAAEHLPLFEANCNVVLLRLKQEGDAYMDALRAQLNKSKLSITQNILSKTIGQLSELPLNWSGNNTTSVTSNILEATRQLNETKKKPLVKSSSFVDDGYLTSESSKSTSGGRESRSRSRLQKTATRLSKSASIRGKKGSASVDRYKTPINNKIPPATYGTVTPKVKPNTPQVLLRRPKIGEVALSLQGSPLLTGNVMTDNVANINIPLDDGRLLSIQPQRGLRLSQIPNLDVETRRQLETLRDNLNKVCALSSTRYVK